MTAIQVSQELPHERTRFARADDKYLCNQLEIRTANGESDDKILSRSDSLTAADIIRVHSREVLAVLGALRKKYKIKAAKVWGQAYVRFFVPTLPNYSCAGPQILYRSEV